MNKNLDLTKILEGCHVGSDKFNSDNYLDSYIWWNILVVRRNKYVNNS